MKRIISGIALASALIVAGCSSTPESPIAVASSSPTTPTSTVQPVPATTAPTSRYLGKEIGEEAGENCTDDDVLVCDLTFTVTAITIEPPCPVYGSTLDPLPADSEIIRIDLDAVTANQLNATRDSSTLLLQYWSVIGPDGYTSRNLDVATGCDVEAGPFYHSMGPMMKERASMPLIVPAGSTTVTLTSNGGGWQWEIPR